MGTTRGLSEVLLQKLETKNDSDFKEIFLSMHNNINETYDLLTNLLQWASAQIKGIMYNPETLALNDFAHKTLKSIANQAEEKNIRMTVDMDKNIEVRADRYMLDAILRNLISNAIKFTNEDGNIVVQAIQKSRAIQVCIKDDGIGMSSDRVNKLFSLDTNTSTNGTKGERGTGLGLIVCKEFLDMHKGKIWVESVPDKGSSFCFTLPAID
jgi:signal transduction histidine kinase